LDEISTRVVEDGHDGGSDVQGWLLKHHALVGESGVLGLDVVDVNCASGIPSSTSAAR